MAMEGPEYYKRCFKMTILLLFLSVLLSQTSSSSTSSTTSPTTSSNVTTTQPTTTATTITSTTVEEQTNTTQESSTRPRIAAKTSEETPTSQATTVTPTTTPSTTTMSTTDPGTSQATRPPGSSHGESCYNTTQCVPGASCIDDECICNATYFNATDGTCKKRPGLTEICDEYKPCVQDAECQNSTCVCRMGYVTLNNSCIFRHPHGGPCSGNEECVDHALCENQTECSCRDTFLPLNKTCISVAGVVPVNVRASSHGTTSITVIWTAPPVCTTILCKYIITYRIETKDRSPKSISTNKTSVMLKDLEADKMYVITVMTLFNDSAGQEVTSKNATKWQKTMNSQAENLTVTTETYYAMVSFEEPENETNRLFRLVVKEADNLTECVVLFRNVPPCPGENSTQSQSQSQNCQAMITDGDTTIVHNITKLSPYTNYTVTVIMVNCVDNVAIESGPAVETFRTRTAVPGPVKNLKSTSNSSHVCVSWTAPEPYPGPLQYTYKLLDNVTGGFLRINTIVHEKACFQQSIFNGFWEYSFIIKAITNRYDGRICSVQSSTNFTTDRRKPTYVDFRHGHCPPSEHRCTVRPETYTDVYLFWKDPSPEKRGTRLTKYVVTDNEGSEETVPLSGFLTRATDAQYRRLNETLYWIRKQVEVGTNKKFRLDTFDDNNTIVSRNTTMVARPIKEPPQWNRSNSVYFVKIESTTLTIVFYDKKFFSNNAYGAIIDKFLLVRYGNCYFPNTFRRRKDLYWSAKRIMYIVNITNIAGLEYVLGSGGKCNGFCNGELTPATTYCIIGVVCTSKGCTRSPFQKTTTKPDNSLTVAIALVCMAVFVGVIVVVAAMLWKYKRSDNRSLQLPLSLRPGIDLSKIAREQPIVLSQVAVRVTELHCDSNRLFSMQYEDLVRISPTHPKNAANLDDNKQKNRYVDVLPFDKSRVVLKVVDNEETSDYINASFLPGYNWDKEYVACQGPLPGTVDDFWRMIWEQNVSIIVMVTSIKENGKVKCEEYWPVDVQEPKQYGNIVVENISFSSLSTFNVNIFKLRIDEKEFKTVKQFHFLNWRDMSADIERNDIIDFVRTVRSYMRPDMAGPMVVHCSAGVGRTGTFICLDYIIQFIENHALEEHIDIFSYVLKLRDNRTRMVQTESQYIFIHDCAKQLVEEQQVALDNVSADELMYVNNEMCPLDQDETEEVKSLIYENAEMKSTEDLVQQTEL